MKNYSITTAADGSLFVAIDGASISGPYKNEESAKRRIRDLKRKDIEQIGRTDGSVGAIRQEAFEAAQHCEQPSDIAVFTPGTNYKAGDIVKTADGPFVHVGGKAIIAASLVGGNVLTVTHSDMLAKLPNVHKLEMSSAYGNMRHNPFDNSCDPTRHTGPRNGYRPAHRANRFRSLRA